MENGKKVVPYGTKHEVKVEKATPQVIIVVDETINEGFVLMGHGEKVLPEVGDTGTIEFTQGGPMGGYWKFINHKLTMEVLEEIVNNAPENVLIDGDAETREVHVDGKLLRPERSQKHHNHSPDGFNWGYGGSGPAQLALAIMLLYVPEAFVSKVYQNFKFKYVAGWPMGKDFEVNIPMRTFLKNELLTTTS